MCEEFSRRSTLQLVKNEIDVAMGATEDAIAILRCRPGFVPSTLTECSLEALQRAKRGVLDLLAKEPPDAL